MSRIPERPVRPGRQRSALRRSAGLIAAVAALFLAAGCGAGQTAQTTLLRPSIDGVNGQAGEIAIRNARVEFPPDGTAPLGGSATLAVTLVNDGRQPDQLVGVSTPVSGLVKMATSPTAGSSPTAGGSPSARTSAAASGAAAAGTASPAASAPSAHGSASPGGRATTSPSVTPSPTSAPAASAGTSGGALSVPLPPGQTVVLGGPAGGGLLLEGLTQDLVSGTTVTVTFSFASGAQVSLPVPISVPSSPQPRTSLSPTAGLGEPRNF